MSSSGGRLPSPRLLLAREPHAMWLHTHDLILVYKHGLIPVGTSLGVKLKIGKDGHQTRKVVVWAGVEQNHVPLGPPLRGLQRPETKSLPTPRNTLSPPPPSLPTSQPPSPPADPLQTDKETVFSRGAAGSSGQ